MILDFTHRFPVITFMSLALFQKPGPPPSALHRCSWNNETSCRTKTFTSCLLSVKPSASTWLGSKLASCTLPMDGPEVPQLHIAKTEHTPLHSLFQQMALFASTYHNHAGFFLRPHPYIYLASHKDLSTPFLKTHQIEPPFPAVMSMVQVSLLTWTSATMSKLVISFLF